MEEKEEKEIGGMLLVIFITVVLLALAFILFSIG